MKKTIFQCKNCYIYTLKRNCPYCYEKTISPKPAKFSIEDKYLRYRLKAKQNEIRD